jgi:hypothetical protein
VSKSTTKKKPNMQDATLVNVRALKKAFGRHKTLTRQAVEALAARVTKLEQDR